MKKLLILLVLCSSCVVNRYTCECKHECVPDQLKTLQQFDAQIEQLRKQQMELILLLIGEPVDPKTLVFDGKKFKATKVK